jgi:selenide,water dikinase
MWRWKDHIDQSFMAKFHKLPTMEQPPLPRHHTLGMAEALGDKPMCGGCGAKVGRIALRAALAPLPGSRRDDITPLPGDDAALLTMGGVKQVISSDHLRAFCADPVVMTRIAAVHALGDIWAMGAEPQAATANLILPRMSPELQERTLREIMEAATGVLQDAGAEIIGGHTSLGDELTIGFTVTGLCPRAPITLAGAQPGDKLILTKPIGSGVIMAAEMAGQADGAWVARALAQMTRSQARAAGILQNAHAMTDVTGFGLYGHLAGICDASHVGAQVNFDLVPLLQGASQLAELGVRSSLFGDNRALAPNLYTTGAQDLLFDPQTAGGLLAAVSESEAEGMVNALQLAGDTAAVIGSMTDATSGIIIC